jgi:hypothetical protein
MLVVIVMMLASSTTHRREGDDKEDNQKHEPDQIGEMMEITWRHFKRMIF